MKNIVNRKQGLDISAHAVSGKVLFTSGIVCAVPFVFPYMALLSWIGYIPLAFCFFADTGKYTVKFMFGRCWLFAYAFYTVGYLWLGELYPLDFIGFDTAQSLVILGLSLIVVPAIHALLFALAFTVCRAVCNGFPAIFQGLLFPFTAVFAELLQSLGALGFPWCRVFVSQAAFPCLLQSASLFGSYFITYFVLLINGLLALAVACRKSKQQRCYFIATAVILFSFNLLFGVFRMYFMEASFKKDSKTTFGAAVLQGNIPSGEKWNGNVADMYERYTTLADNALDSLEAQGIPAECSLFLTPESALPITLRENSRYKTALKDYVNQKGFHFGVGAFSEQDGKSGNAIFMFSPGKDVSKPYIKRHLVPFGEYLPYRTFFEKYIPALAQISVFEEDLVTGNETVLFDTPIGKVGTLICYESIFSELCRDTVSDGADILLISTNDSWFGSSGALRHHLAQAQMRAIENNVPVLRAANTGISALIYPDGRVISSLDPDRTGFLAGRLPYGTHKTLYTQIGDLIIPAWGFFLLVLGTIAAKRGGNCRCLCFFKFQKFISR